MAHSKAINEFGMTLFRVIAAENAGHKAISPLSLSSALGMVHLGAKDVTNIGLRQVLGYNTYKITDDVAHNAYKNLFDQIRVENYRQYVSKTSDYVLNVANRVMALNIFDVMPTYYYQLKINYDASIQSVDFANDGQMLIPMKTINAWIADKTSGKIQSLLEAPPEPDTSLVILNGIDFKGKWLHAFKPEKSKEGFVAFNKYNFIRCEELHADIVDLPYIGGDISMYIVLPHTLNGLQKTSSALTEQKLINAIKSMRTECVDLYLPKFKIEVEYRLVSELKFLGLDNIFTDNADFSGIKGSGDLLVSDVVHKVFINVNEEGCEAVGTTIASMRETGRSPPPREFKVDHPFIFVIRDKRNDKNLFYGQITELRNLELKQ